MTRSTWDRIVNLMNTAIDLEEAWKFEEAKRINEVVDNILKKVGIDLASLEWDMIDTSYSDATIDVYNDKGDLIQAFNVLEGTRKLA